VSASDDAQVSASDDAQVSVPNDAQLGASDHVQAAGLGDLSTEEVRPELATLDLLNAADLVALLAADSRRAADAVATAGPSISAAVDVVCQRLSSGGRLIYVGAGTAGRLAVLDAAELGPTFDVQEGTVEAVIAGGDQALRHAAEGAEDDKAAGATALEKLAVNEADVVIGVSASGRTPFVLGAIEHAKSTGAATIGLTCNAMSPLSSAADNAIEVVVGGEVVAGSSRLNAGTAQKITLNTISTAAMVRLGKTYGNLMVDVRATNSKLRDRATRIVQAVAGVGPERAVEALQTAGWSTKLACLVASSGKDLQSASEALGTADGRLRQALALLSAGPGDPAPPEAGVAGAAASGSELA
jgi:N-acetylmuramic acid 6-phosphate etherase